MKRFICFLIALTLFTVTAVAALPPDYNFADKNYNKDEWKKVEYLLSPESFAGIKGDADRDGTLSSSDARYALRTSAELENPSVHQITSADIDSDQQITAADARSILRLSCKIDNLPVPVYNVKKGSNFSVGPFGNASYSRWKIKADLEFTETVLEPANRFMTGDTSSQVFTFFCKKEGRYKIDFLYTKPDTIPDDGTPKIYSVILNVD